LRARAGRPRNVPLGPRRMACLSSSRRLTDAACAAKACSDQVGRPSAARRYASSDDTAASTTMHAKPLLHPAKRLPCPVAHCLVLRVRDEHRKNRGWPPQSQGGH
jgi:hypothetical protein